MAIQLLEALYLLRELEITEVSVEALLRTFTGEPEAPTEETKEAGLPPPPEPPKPPQGLPVGVYATYAEAKKRAGRGNEPVYDKEQGGFVNMKS